MEEVADLVELIKSLKSATLTGDILTAVLIIAALAVIVFVLIMQNRGLKEYIDIWRPARFKEDWDAMLSIVKQTHEAQIEDLKARLEAAESPENIKQKAVELFEERDKELMKFMEEYLLSGEIQLDHLLPSSASVETEFVDTDDVKWADIADAQWVDLQDAAFTYKYGDPEKLRQLIVQSSSHGLLSKVRFKGKPPKWKLLEPKVIIEADIVEDDEDKEE